MEMNMPTMVYLTTGAIMETGKEKSSWTDPNDDCKFFAKLHEHLYFKKEHFGQTNF